VSASTRPAAAGACRLWLDAATAADLDAIVELERRSFSHPWSARHFKDAMRNAPRTRVLLLREPFAAGDPGRGIRAYSVVQAVADEMHVHNLAVEPRSRRHGLGRLLMDLALDWGRRRGARRAFLEVRPSNAAALALYRSLGFRTLSLRRRYYQHPTEDALVLEKTDL
jgi:[ribosomal protein S18]-alanine N-acetyltransferase